MRASGILMPIFSLPSDYGIGTFGKEAYRFVDFLKAAGQTYWQILPIGTTGFGDSPYQSFSSYAGNPYFIDLDRLIEEDLLSKSDILKYSYGNDSSRVDYEKLFESRYKVLETAYQHFQRADDKEFEEFKKNNSYWLDDYALFCSVKHIYHGKAFNDWDEGYKHRKKEYIDKAKAELKEPIEFYKTLQYWFFRQWFQLKDYANKNGVKIIGDIPIYVAYDSADVWSHPEIFKLNESLEPVCVAGCPPDAFSDVGQLWGNPIYDWDNLKSDDYEWWIDRIKFATKLYDTVRMDHFRGFSAYYEIPSGESTAVNGKWIKGPGKDFFDTVNERLGFVSVIAEDLGILDDAVRDLLKYTGYPGMRVLQFAFDPKHESDYLPHNMIKNCVCYTGTHDNDTAMGFLKDGKTEEVEYAKKYMHISDNSKFNWELIKTAMAAPADMVILQMQDFLGLDNSARINKPSTIGENWRWRIDGRCINSRLSELIRECTSLYWRLQ